MLEKALAQLKSTIKSCKPLYLAALKLNAGFRTIKLLIQKLVTLIFKLIELVSTSKHFRASKFESFSDDFVISQLGKEHYLVSTSDTIIGRRLYISGEFDFSKFTRAWKMSGLHNTEKTVTLIDVGANVGSIGIPAVKRGYASRCLAFEPEPLNAKLLKTNVILNDLEDKFDVFQIALGDQVGNVLFELSDSNFGDHRVRLGSSREGLHEEQNRKTISVPMKTLNDYFDYIENKEACLIWMDTQGFEGYVLKGADQFIKHSIPMVLEFWPYGLKRSGCYDVLLDCFESSEYEYFINLDSGDKNKTPLSRKSLEVLCKKLVKTHEDHFTDLLVL